MGLRFATLAAVLPLVLGPLSAQEAETVTGGHLVTLQFRGGTLADYVSAVRETGPAVNIMLAENADLVPVPAVKLTQVPVSGALQAAASVVGDVAHVDVRCIGGPVGKDIYAVAVQMKGQAGPVTATVQATPPVKSRVRVYSLGFTRSEAEVKTVLNAVEQGLELCEEASPILRFHEDSRLLFVRGSRDQGELVESVLARLSFELSQSRGAGGAGGGTTPGRAGGK
ncbi:MAG: hypothetical protein AAF628_05635 [Planctomycetota bacterium]